MDNPQHSLDDALVRNAIWREDHYDPKLCDHGGDGGPTCAYCEPHDDDTPDDWPADKERAERQARAALEAAGVAELREEIERLRKALTRIEQNFGHCSTCGTPCEGFTDCDCERPSWDPDDPVEVACSALNPRQNEEEGE